MGHQNKSVPGSIFHLPPSVLLKTDRNLSPTALVRGGDVKKINSHCRVLRKLGGAGMMKFLQLKVDATKAVREKMDPIISPRTKN